MMRGFPIIRNLALFLGGSVGGWLAYSKFAIDHDMPLPPAVDAPRHEFHGKHSGFLSYYADTRGEGRPLVLIHSINAAASTYEMRPLFERYQGSRPVYSLDLPGFGFSERSDRVYSPELYRNAILDFLTQIVDEPADIVTLSLSSEFVAAAATRAPDRICSIALISPTGFTRREDKPRSQAAAENQTTDTLYSIFSNPLWSRPFYDLLTIRASIRFFFSLQFVGEPNEGLVDYAYRAAHQPGAHYAPIYFLSGKLFTTNVADDAYLPLDIPSLVLYDEDPNVSFDLLPLVLDRNTNWRARRIPETRGLPHWEKPIETGQALDTFWQST